MSTSHGITSRTDNSSIHQLTTSQTHPVTTTSTTTTQISQQQQQLNGCEVVNNKSRQILINHSNDANVGIVSENYLQRQQHQQQQVKVSHHHETPNEIRFEESLKNSSEANQSSSVTNAIAPSGRRKISVGDENGMITIVTINNNDHDGNNSPII